MAKPWDRYITPKAVRAREITGRKDFSHWLVGTGKDQEEFTPTNTSANTQGNIGDWALVHPDGHKSICPKGQFEKNYEAL